MPANQKQAWSFLKYKILTHIHIIYSVANNENDNDDDINDGNDVDNDNQNDGGDADSRTFVINIPIINIMIVYTKIFHAFGENSFVWFRPLSAVMQIICVVKPSFA